METNLKVNLNFDLKHSRRPLWWLTIPAGLAFFGSLVVFIFSSFYDREIAIYFGNFFHQWFGNFLAHWANYTGNKMIFLAIVPAIIIIVETYFLKAQIYKSQGFLAKNKWLLAIFYLGLMVIFFAINITDLLKQRFADRGWGPGITTNFIETYETGLIYKSVFAFINLVFYASVAYWVHFRLVPNRSLIKNDYWVSSFKILMFAGLIYGVVGITKLAFGRPYYFSNIFEFNQFDPGGKTILQEMEEAGFGPPTSPSYLQLPYMEWWEPFRPYPHWGELFNFDLDPYLFNVDFPSGHLASAAILLSVIFYGIDHGKKRSTRWLIIAFCYAMFVQLLSVYIGMVIYRFHWMSDMAFTMMFNVIFIWFVHVKVNFWYQAGVLDKYLPLLTKNDKINMLDYKKNQGSFS